MGLVRIEEDDVRLMQKYCAQCRAIEEVPQAFQQHHHTFLSSYILLMLIIHVYHAVRLIMRCYDTVWLEYLWHIAPFDTGENSYF